MKVLLVTDNKDLKELLSFQLTSRLPSSVKECLTEDEVVGELKKDKYDFLVAFYSGPDSPALKFIREEKNPISIIFFFDPKGAKPDQTKLAGLNVLGSVEMSSVKIVEDIVAFAKPSADGGGDVGLQNFCPIRTNLLIRVSPLKSDIYIRLSGEKFVKLFQSGDEFDQNDLARYYEEKKVEYMFLRRTEVSEFVTKFTTELDQLINKPDLKPEEAIQTAEMTQETIHELVHKVGFNAEVQNLAKKNVELSLKAIGNQPKLSNLIQKVIKDGNYLSQHSTLLAHMTCCVAKEMDWGSEATFSKLVLASFMHDISLTHPDLAKINSLTELEEKKSSFPEDAVKSYHLHPAKSADVVRAFQEIPPDVDLIVLQHHERPTGGGFPRGLAHNYIAPLSAVFIVAHEMVQAILAEKERFNLPLFVNEKKKFFSQGNFKKVMTALEKVKV